MSNQDPTRWFNQFRPEELSAAGIQGNAQWCERHWAPCPMLDGNGIKASVMLASAAVQNALNDESPWCCQIGDVGMYLLWGACPPARNERP